MLLLPPWKEKREAKQLTGSLRMQQVADMARYFLYKASLSNLPVDLILLH